MLFRMILEPMMKLSSSINEATKNRLHQRMTSRVPLPLDWSNNRLVHRNHRPVHWVVWPRLCTRHRSRNKWCLVIDYEKKQPVSDDSQRESFKPKIFLSRQRIEETYGSIRIHAQRETVEQCQWDWSIRYERWTTGWSGEECDLDRFSRCIETTEDRSLRCPASISYVFSSDECLSRHSFDFLPSFSTSNTSFGSERRGTRWSAWCWTKCLNLFYYSSSTLRTNITSFGFAQSSVAGVFSFVFIVL